MKERPILFSGSMVRALLDGAKTQTRRVVKPRKDLNFGCLLQPHEIAGEVNAGSHVNIPYGKPGDRLWVRESGWERPERTPKMMREGADTWRPYYYAADGEDGQELRAWGFKARPSIHMPRWASRILLEIVSVRVEKLNAISRGDAMAEGCPFPNMASSEDPRNWYAMLWDSINGAGSWAANPYVWVVEFRRIKP